MLETAWESRWLPGLLKQQGDLLSYIIFHDLWSKSWTATSPLPKAILNGEYPNHRQERRSLEDSESWVFKWSKDQNSNLKTSYSRDNDFKIILNIKTSENKQTKSSYWTNIKCNAIHSRLNNQERRVDALALRAEERRDKLRKALGSCK